MAIEFTGVMHSSYLIQYILAAVSGKPVESKEAPKSALQFVFFWGRVLMSLAILGFSLAVTFAALFQGKTTMWDGVPEIVSIILFVGLMSVVGMLEGMQIAFFAVAKLPASERGNSFWAKKTCDLLFSGNGQNLPGFMIGRQLCVVSCFFVVARVTTLNVEVGTGENIFGVSDGVQEFLNTGLHAAVITTILASITWQLAASAFPRAFLASPFTYFLLVIALTLEATGVCAGAWALARVVKKIMGLQYDEVYIGTPEERVGSGKASKDPELGEETTRASNPKVMRWMSEIQSEYRRLAEPGELGAFCTTLMPEGAKARTAPDLLVNLTMASEGMKASGESNPEQLFQGCTVTPNTHIFPSPKHLACELARQQQEVPCFLLPPSHPLHVPPHIVAFWLMSQRVEAEKAHTSAKLEKPDVTLGGI
jgi:hypothetical protein